MPEGHLIRIAADRQTAALGGKKLRVASPQGRFAEGAAAVDGRTLKQVEGVGKLLFYHFGKAGIVQVHLGRLGYFKYHGKSPAEPTPGVRMRLTHRAETIDLIAPITCKLIDAKARAAEVAKLGPDPLSPHFDEPAAREIVWAKTSGTKRSIAQVMLDQSVWAGVGLIFVTEALLRVGLRPDVRGCVLLRGSG